MDFLWGVLYFIIGVFGVMIAVELIIFLIMAVKFIQVFWRDN